MQDDFDLDVILSVLTGMNLTYFTQIYDFYSFIFEEELLIPEEIPFLRHIALQHLLRIHPELQYIKYDRSISLNDWIDKQKSIFGEKMTVSVVGENIVKLEKQPVASAR